MRKEQAQALLTSIAEQWLPVAGSDAHTVGGFSPTNAAPSLYAVSYGTKKALPAVWNFYAAKLGVTNLYRENQTFVLGGQNERGNFALVERSAGVLRDDTIFCLRTPEFTVSATFKPGSGDWQTVGNVVVALEQAASAKALAR